MPKNKQVIRFQFTDGQYSFWCARAPGAEARIVFRVKETGEGAWLTPQKRLENLVHELIAGRDPESVEVYDKFTDIFPADLSIIARWFAGHVVDLQDFLEGFAEFGSMTKAQKAAFRHPPKKGKFTVTGEYTLTTTKKAGRKVASRKGAAK